jgi:hypothetical protein
MRLVTAAARCRSSVRRSMALVVRHAGQRTQRYQNRAAMAAPIVGENSMGIRLAWRSFQAPISRSASSGRAPRCRFFAGDAGALILHLAAVEAHGWGFRRRARVPQATLYIVGHGRTFSYKLTLEGNRRAVPTRRSFFAALVDRGNVGKFLRILGPITTICKLTRVGLALDPHFVGCDGLG